MFGSDLRKKSSFYGILHDLYVAWEFQVYSYNCWRKVCSLHIFLGDMYCNLKFFVNRYLYFEEKKKLITAEKSNDLHQRTCRVKYVVLACPYTEFHQPLVIAQQYQGTTEHVFSISLTLFKLKNRVTGEMKHYRSLTKTNCKEVRLDRSSVFSKYFFLWNWCICARGVNNVECERFKDFLSYHSYAKTTWRIEINNMYPCSDLWRCLRKGGRNYKLRL